MFHGNVLWQTRISLLFKEFHIFLLFSQIFTILSPFLVHQLIISDRGGLTEFEVSVASSTDYVCRLRHKLLDSMGLRFRKVRFLGGAKNATTFLCRHSFNIIRGDKQFGLHRMMVINLVCGICQIRAHAVAEERMRVGRVLALLKRSIDTTIFTLT